jgi:hypothetical protein
MKRRPTPAEAASRCFLQKTGDRGFQAADPLLGALRIEIEAHCSRLRAAKFFGAS